LKTRITQTLTRNRDAAMNDDEEDLAALARFFEEEYF
jgi:hypothetical protein